MEKAGLTGEVTNVCSGSRGVRWVGWGGMARLGGLWEVGGQSEELGRGRYV